MHFPAEANPIDATVNASVHVLKTAHSVLLNKKPHCGQNGRILGCANAAAHGKPVIETNFYAINCVKFLWQNAEMYCKTSSKSAQGETSGYSAHLSISIRWHNSINCIGKGLVYFTVNHLQIFRGSQIFKKFAARMTVMGYR